MLQMICPTCGELLGNKQLIYEQKVKELENKNISNEKINDEKRKIINSLNIDENKYCCRQRIIGFIDTNNIVK